MAVLITLSFAGAGPGYRFDALQKLGRLEPKLCQSSTKPFSHKWFHCKCFWQEPRSKNLTLKSRELRTLRLARGKEAEDSFASVRYFVFLLSNSCELVLVSNCVAVLFQKEQSYETSFGLVLY